MDNLPPAKLPTAIWIACPVALFVLPARLLLSHVIFPGNAGYSAHAAMKTPAYTSPGTLPPAIHMMKPTAMMHRHTKMNGYRFPTLSLNHSTTTAKTDAVI